MDNFSQDIQEFKKTGEYVYNFDEGGNLVFNQTSKNFYEHYVSLPLLNCGYNDTKINSFYDLSFKEFIPTTSTITQTTVVSEEVTQLTEENQSLKNKLSELTGKADANITEAEKLAIKQVIIELRIKLKQGSYERDFSTDFPYLPITKNT